MSLNLTEKRKKRVLRAFIFTLMLIPILYHLSTLDWSVTGNDTQTHLYKVHILINQIKYNPLNAGLWDWSWYNGNDFLQTYSPLFYWCDAILSLALNVTPETSIAIIIYLSFISSAIGMYLLSKKLVKNFYLSLMSSALFVYIPEHLFSLAINGQVTRIIGYAPIPFIFYFAECYLKDKRNSQFLLSAFCLCATILFNDGTGLVIAATFLVWYLIRKQTWIAFSVPITASLLCSFFILPYLYSPRNRLPVLIESTDIVTNIDVTFSKIAFGNVIPFVGILLIFLCIATYRKALDYILKQRNFVSRLKMLWAKSKAEKNYITFSIIIILLLTALYNLTAFWTQSPFLGIPAFMRSFPIGLLFVPLAYALVLKRIKLKRIIKRFIVLCIIIMIMIESAMVPSYVPLQNNLYMPAYEIIKKDPEFSKYVFLPGEPVPTTATLVTNKSTILGWYHEAISKEQFDILGSLINKEFMRLENGLAFGNTTEYILILKYYGVKYIILESADPVYPSTAKAMGERMDGHPLLEKVLRYESVYLFRIRNYYPIYAYADIPYTFSDVERKLSNRNAYELNSINFLSPSELQIILNVKQKVSIVIPITNSRTLKITMNDIETVPITAFGGLMAVELNPGINKISLVVKMNNAGSVGFTISCATLIIGIVLSISPSTLKLVRKKIKLKMIRKNVR